MNSRYEDQEIKRIWSEINKLEKWKYYQSVLSKAWFLDKKFPIDISNEIISAEISIDKMKEIELQTKHDVIAFNKMLSSNLSDEARKWIHFGITSTDMVDTCNNLLINESFEYVNQIHSNLINEIDIQINNNKNKFIVGRTHGVNAEPIEISRRFDILKNELLDTFQELHKSISKIKIVKASGSLGNYLNIDESIEKSMANIISNGFYSRKMNTQVIPRYLYSSVIFNISNYASILEKNAINIRLSHQSGIEEIQEGFDKNQKGSSSMPHKKNPIICENITGLSRVIRSYVTLSLENNILWQERDISHSSVERIIFPDVFHLLSEIIKKSTSLVKNLFINYEKISENFHNTFHISLSQQIMNEIISKSPNTSRDEIYEYIKISSDKARKDKKSLLLVLKENNIYKIDLQKFDKYKI